MAPDTTALQRVWVCTDGVGLVRADWITSLILNDGRVNGAAAERADEHDTLAAVLDNGTRVNLANCGTIPGWRAVAALAIALGQAAQASAADGSTLFVFACTAPDGGVSWHRSEELDNGSWPAEPVPSKPLNTPTRQRRRSSGPDDDDPLFVDDGPAAEDPPQIPTDSESRHDHAE